MTDLDLKQFGEKTIGELEEIWRNQDDYLPEVAGAVQEELSRRGVSVESVQVNEVSRGESDRRKMEKRWGKILLRVFSGFQLLVGVSSSVVGLIETGEVIQAMGRPGSGSTAVHLGIALLFTAFGLTLILGAVFLWLGRRWAWRLSVTFCLLAAAGSVAQAVIPLAGPGSIPLAHSVFSLLISLILLAMLFSAKDAIGPDGKGNKLG